MRRPLTVLAAITVAGGMLLVPQTANAQTFQHRAANAPVTAQQAPPLSPLKLTAYYPRRAYAGRTITYTLKTKNVGDWYTDIAYVGGYVPKQAYKVRITGPSGSYCEADGREVGCLLDRLNPGRTATVKVKVWLRGSARGTAAAEFATASIDVPAGGLDTLDIHGLDTGVDLKYVKVRTRILR
ncbi:hypothetical protein Ppa06_51010 [Planomonospora parontospora subsp. parontospora]|uniref:DUF11 domain-containing protein n=2 Tax=Planomonospora parontospora TaxID=58119 RepID=A0AA37BJX9_9ACTN|nr:hypothetical protein [Planomonospora parontospora]GGK80167.1 hypothetical protein GCM10010126_44400 [Planomonospora parontospora]GII11303.1 hypothetical protein Ppa06_51010 [Planomonospora parontospora subsp. parontospora]